MMTMLHAPSRFPESRPRRLRQQPWVRALTAEYQLAPQHLIWPLFVREGQGEQEAVATLPGVFRLSIDQLILQAKAASEAGIQALALFPVTPPERKTEDGREALNPDNLMCRALRAVKAAVPDIGLIADVALDPYTSHGHDGLLQQGQVVNDPTLEVLCQQALLLANAGADVVAPSDMMDGRIGAIRQALDCSSRTDTLILSYAVKYASAFYGPFRDAVGSSSALKGDKQTYQMAPSNRREAWREAAMDVAEGADMLMVKPGMPYLDILADIAAHSPLPVLTYQVSGEYRMLHALADGDEQQFHRLMHEALLGFRRAGAQAILTYAALDMARSL